MVPGPLQCTPLKPCPYIFLTVNMVNVRTDYIHVWVSTFMCCVPAAPLCFLIVFNHFFFPLPFSLFFFMAQNFNFLFFSPFALIFWDFSVLFDAPLFLPSVHHKKHGGLFFYHSFNTKFLIFQSIMVFPFDCESIIQSWLLWYDTHTLFPFFLYSKVLQPKLGWV